MKHNFTGTEYQEDKTLWCDNHKKYCMPWYTMKDDNSEEDSEREVLGE